MGLSLHPDVEARLRARAESEGLTPEASVERLLRADQQAHEELEALALAGLDSGEPIEAGPTTGRKSIAAWTSGCERPVGEPPLCRASEGVPASRRSGLLLRDQRKPHPRGHRFLVAAHQTLALLANQPEMGWHPRLKHPALEAVRVFRVSGFTKVLVLYRAVDDGVDILRLVHGSRNLQALLRREALE